MQANRKRVVQKSIEKNKRRHFLEEEGQRELTMDEFFAVNEESDESIDKDHCDPTENHPINYDSDAAEIEREEYELQYPKFGQNEMYIQEPEMINEEEPQQVAFEDADETDSDSDLDEFVIQHAMLHQIENPDIPIPTNTAHGQYPEWLHYPGTKRPDGVLYEFLSRENWNIAPINPGDIIIHLIELFVTTAGYIDKKKLVKEKQYSEIINWLHSQGYTRIKLHLIPLTVEGFIPTECKETLKKLGVRPAQWNELNTQGWKGKYESVNRKAGGWAEEWRSARS